MDDHKTVAQSFAEAFAAALSASVALAGGSPWRLALAEDSDPPAQDAHPLQFRMKVEGRLSGECFIEFYDPHLSAQLAGMDGNESQSSAADLTNTLLPVLNAAVAQLKASLAVQYGQLTLEIERVSELACGGMFVVPLRVSSQLSSPPSVFLYFDGRLLKALSSAIPDRGMGNAASQQFHPANLRLVMDVELNVSLRFGQRQLPLREVLELASGSVIELDKMVDEPVEMLLDGKVVARGEAVIVDGNYGLRITEIPQAIDTHLLGF